jgi:hypothetical protein
VSLLPSASALRATRRTRGSVVPSPPSSRSRSSRWLQLGGCPEETQPNDDDAPPSCTLAFLGDQSKDPSIELIYFGADQMDHPLVDGGEIDLIFPPQGGRVLFVGVRATNVDPCAGEAHRRAARHVDRAGPPRHTNGEPARRRLGLRREHAWRYRELRQRAGLPEPVDGSRRFRRELRARGLADRRARSHGDEVVQVKPRCAEPANEAECLCICQGGYVLGQQCTDPTGSVAVALAARAEAASAAARVAACERVARARAMASRSSWFVGFALTALALGGCPEEESDGAGGGGGSSEPAWQVVFDGGRARSRAAQRVGQLVEGRMGGGRPARQRGLRGARAALRWLALADAERRRRRLVLVGARQLGERRVARR